MIDLLTLATDIAISAASLVLWAAQAVLVFFTTYVILMGFAGLTQTKSQKTSCRRSPTRNFAILIPARDEESVIGQCLDSLRHQRYPSHCVHVYVVADNCVDKTAVVARERGAVVHERFCASTTQQTKGHALRFLFDRLRQSGHIADVYLVLDADNVTAPDFLARINGAFDAGHHVVQGQRLVKNPNESWLTRLECINHALTSLEQSGRSHLSLPCRLHGSATAFSTVALDVLGNWPTCLEDASSLQAFYVLHGLNPVWCPTAKVYDEQVVSLLAFQKQRTRWRLGHRGAFFNYFGMLLRRGILERDLRKCEQALYLARLQLPLSILVSAVCFFAVLSLLTHLQSFVLGQRVWLLLLVLQAAYVFVGGLSARVSPMAYLALLLSPIVALSSVWSALMGLVGRESGWVKTQHSALVVLDHLQGDEQADRN